MSQDQGATWAEREFGGADLGDPRLTKRLIKISAKFAGNPCASIPLASETPDRLKAAYRFFDHGAVNELEILAPHGQANKTRKAGQAMVLELAEWQALHCHHHQTKTPPPQPPTLGAAVRMIGRLGGFIGRKSDGHPGSTVIWRGLQRLQDLAAAWRRWRGA